MPTYPENLKWSSTGNPPALEGDDLHLWRIDCGPGGASLAFQWAILSEGECDRAQRLRLVLHRERYVRAHAGLRRILSLYADTAPERIEFGYGRFGKPLLEGDSGHLEFNMTTTADLSLVALSRGLPVGVDCEELRDRGDPTAIARRMFPHHEAELVDKADEEDQLEIFYRYWTALEARVKADGTGLFRHQEPTTIDGLQIRNCVPQSGFVAAVARAALPPHGDWRTFAI